MNENKEKNPAAVALGKQRWANKTPAEKTSHALMMAFKSAIVRRKTSPKCQKQKELEEEMRFKLRA